MFVNFSEETRHILKQAEKEKDDLNHPYVGSEHLFLSILKDSKLIEIFKKYNITYDKFKEKLINTIGIGKIKSPFTLYTPLLKRILENVVMDAKEENNKSVSPELIIIYTLNEEDGIAYNILRSLRVNIDKLYFDIKIKKTNKINKSKKLFLNEVGTDLTLKAKEQKLDPLIGRQDEIRKIIEILLRRKKNNPILIGPAGVGKTAIVEGIANLIISNECPNYLKNKKIISIDIFSLVSGTKYRGEFEEKMKNLVKELEENNDIIVFIDEIHTLVGAGGAEGAIDASNILKPALARGSIKVIGATTMDEYKKYIEPESALSRRFQNIIIKEPNKDELIKLLMKIKPLYEKHHNIRISNELIEEIVTLSNKYIINRFEPDRSIDILDEVCARTSLKENVFEKNKKHLINKLDKIKQYKIKAIEKKDFKLAYLLKTKENNIINKLDKNNNKIKFVNKKDILEVIKSKSNIETINSQINKFYEKIKVDLNSIIYGQEKNIDKLINSLRKKETLNINKCHSILITGKTGSGKTYLAKSYLEKIVGDKNIINIDLSEYKDHHMISKLIGTTAGYLGYDNKNNIFEKIRTNPSTGIIVDNFSEGCVEVQNLFVKILENNKIEDSSGKLIDFSNTKIVFLMDSNDKENSLGFSKNNNFLLEYIPKSLLSKINVILSMENINDENIKRIINKKINDIKNEYLFINIDSTLFEEYLYKEIKKNNNLSIIDNKIENDFKEQIAEAIINKKDNIIIKVTSDITI